MLEKGERGKRIVEGIVPMTVGGVLGEISQAEGVAKIAERMRLFSGPGGAGKLQGVNPRAEAVAGEGAEEAFFGAMPVGYDGAAAEVAFENRPEGEEGRGVAKVISGDAVDFLSRPSDVLVTLEEGDEGGVNVGGVGPGAEADLDRSIGPAFGGAGGLEVDGGEGGLGDLDREEVADGIGNENLISCDDESIFPIFLIRRFTSSFRASSLARDGTTYRCCCRWKADPA